MSSTFLPQLWSDEIIKRLIDSSVLIKVLMEKSVIYWDFVPLDEKEILPTKQFLPALRWENLQACVFS